MREIASFFGSGFFFTPFAYFVFYIYVERHFSDNSLLQNVLKIFTALAGLLLMIYAWTAPIDFTVFVPGRAGMKNYIPASVFLMVVGIATMALPLYSKYLRFSKKNEQ